MSSTATPSVPLIFLMQLRTLVDRVEPDLTPEQIVALRGDFDRLLGEWNGDSAEIAAALSATSPEGSHEEAPQNATPPQDGATDPQSEEDTIAISRRQFERIRREREANAWRARLQRNPNLQPSDKLAASAVYDLWNTTAERSDEGYLPMTRADMATRMGCTEQAVSARLEALEGTGGIKRRPFNSYDDKTGLQRTHLRLEVRPAFLESPDQLRTMGNGWGGKRTIRYCKNPRCQSTNLVERVEIVCRDCGTVQYEREHDVNEGLLGASSAAASPNISPAQHLDFGRESASESTEDDAASGGAQELPSFLQRCPMCGDLTWINDGFKCAKCDTVAGSDAGQSPAHAVPVAPSASTPPANTDPDAAPVPSDGPAIEVFYAEDFLADYQDDEGEAVS